MARASEDKLADLHNAAAEVLTEMVTPKESVGEDGKITRTLPSAAEVAVAVKFLKDNSVFMAPNQSTAVEELEELVRKRRPSKRDLDDALRTVGQGLIQ